MTAYQTSQAEGDCLHYRVEGSTPDEVTERIASITKAAQAHPCRVVFTAPKRMPHGRFRAAGWVDPC